MNTPSSGQPYVVISADNHAGADLLDYRPYLESRWHDEFDAWAGQYENPWNFIDPQLGEEGFEAEDAILSGASSTHTSLNWDGDKRVAHMESNGVVGEVLYPNTAPPFMPTSVLAGVAPGSRDDYEHWWAGLKAHNRWLVDFCNATPGRRAGVAQIMLYDVDDAIAEVRAVHAAGLTGGVLLPMDPRDSGGSIPLYFSDFEPLWAVCDELQMPVHRHSSTPNNFTVDERTGDGVIAIGFAERQFYNHRPLAQFILGGIFERHPGLKLIFAESGSGWVPQQLKMLDALYAAGNDRDGLLGYMYGGTSKLSMLPSEYYARNVFLGASLFLRSEAEYRYEIGVDNIMWGVDYPHAEGTFPFTLEALRHTFHDVPPAEVRKMLGETAAKVYNFDLAFLQQIADRVGPTEESVAQPPTSLPRVPEESMSPVFGRIELLELERGRH